MTVPAANVPSFSNLMKQQMKLPIKVNYPGIDKGPLWVSVQLRDGESITAQRLGRGVTISGNPAGMVTVGLQSLRLRWVLTPDLDGRQLQYCFGNDEWHPITTEFHASRIETGQVFKLVPVTEKENTNG